MKWLFSASLVAAAVVTSAPSHAYDVPRPINWTGFYVGANVGGAWSHTDLNTSTIYDPAHLAGYFGDTVNTNLFNSIGTQHTSESGLIAGGQAGFNWQINSAVVGLETDFQSFHQSGSSGGSAKYLTGGGAGSPFTISSSFSTEWLWTLRPRLGFAADNWLVYATGGLALTHIRANYLFVDGFADTEAAELSKTKTGWVVGGGVEYALANGWSVKAEYLHLDFGTTDVTTNNLLDSGTVPVPRQPFTHSVKLTSDIARVGVNYRFGSQGLTR